MFFLYLILINHQIFTIMKKILIVMLVSAFLFFDTGCKKAIEDGIDCVIESMFAVIHADVDSNNPKLMHFKFSIVTSDGLILDHSLHWDFGDGNSVTADTLTDHEYGSTGSYDVKVSYTLRKGSESCSTSKTKNITIN